MLIALSANGEILSDENSWPTGGHKHLRVRLIILLALLRGIQYTSFSYYFGVPIYRAVKEVFYLLFSDRGGPLFSFS